MRRGSPPRLSTSGLEKKNTQEETGVAETRCRAGLRRETLGWSVGRDERQGQALVLNRTLEPVFEAATAERQSGRSRSCSYLVLEYTQRQAISVSGQLARGNPLHLAAHATSR